MSPSLAADPSGVVHLVWEEEINPGEFAMLYSKLEGGQWSDPIDIHVATDMGSIDAPVLLSDSQGVLHLVFSANQEGILYSSAFAPDAGSANGWSSPVTLVPPVYYLTHADLAIGPDGRLHVVYIIQIGSGSGVYYTTSADGGGSWQDPLLIYSNSDIARYISQPKVAVSENGTIHVVWVEQKYPEIFPPLGIRYSSSTDGIEWSDPTSLADGPYADLEIATNRDEVHVVWSGTATDRYKFHIWSADSGRNWSSVYRNLEIGGLHGYPALTVDGSNNLHWLTSGGYYGAEGEASTGYLFEYKLLNDIWSQGTLLASTPLEVKEQNMGRVAADISLGNQMAVIMEDPRLKDDGSWQMDLIYVGGNIDSQAIPPQSLMTPLIAAVKIPSTTPLVTSTPTTLPVFSKEPPQGEFVINNYYFIAAPVVIVILVVFGINRLGKWRKQ